MFCKLRIAAVLLPVALAGCLYPYFPTAEAGPDQSVTEGSVVQLNGSGTDEDGKVVKYQWEQVAGPAVKLSGVKTKKLKFKAPDVDVQTNLEFELTVVDNLGAPSKPDKVTVTVNQIRLDRFADLRCSGNDRNGHDRRAAFARRFAAKFPDH
jgi:hypothetical protein